MTATIAGISGWTGFEGTLFRSHRRIIPLPVQPGSNDQALAIGGWTTEPVRIISRRVYTGVSALSDALNGELTCRQTMTGAATTVVDPLGRTWPVRVLRVQCRRYRLITGAVVLEAVWDLLVEVESNPPAN